MCSPRMEPVHTAELLIGQLGAEAAIRQANRERVSARRARSRQRYQFWETVVDRIEGAAQSRGAGRVRDIRRLPRRPRIDSASL